MSKPPKPLLLPPPPSRDDGAAALRDYVLRTGVMPDALVRELRGGLLSHDPAAQVFAARQVAALEKENPALVADTLEGLTEGEIQEVMKEPIRRPRPGEGQGRKAPLFDKVLVLVVRCAAQYVGIGFACYFVIALVHVVRHNLSRCATHHCT